MLLSGRSTENCLHYLCLTVLFHDIAGIRLAMTDKISTRILSHVKFFCDILSTKPKHRRLFDLVPQNFLRSLSMVAFPPRDEVF